MYLHLTPRKDRNKGYLPDSQRSDSLGECEVLSITISYRRLRVFEIAVTTFRKSNQAENNQNNFLDSQI